MSSSSPHKKKYHVSAVALHWLMAITVIVMLVSGLYMVNGEMPKSDQYNLYQLHKAGGVVMLWAVCLRIAIRLLTHPPDFPAELSSNNRRMARLGHMVLYAALIGLTVSGWFMVSSSPFGLPTFVFVDWIKWPHIPWVSRNKTIESLSNTSHWVLAYSIIVLVLGHVVAIMYHYKVHNINLVKRMWFRE